MTLCGRLTPCGIRRRQSARSCIIRRWSRLSAEDAVYACRLVGVSIAAQHDQRARACLGEIMRDGWRRAWQTVSAGDSISLERFREMHPVEQQQELDRELVVLTWYAGICGVQVVETPMREALDHSLVKALHRLTLAMAEIDPASRSRYDAALRYDHVWWRAASGDAGDQALAMRLSAARDILRAGNAGGPGCFSRSRRRLACCLSACRNRCRTRRRDSCQHACRAVCSETDTRDTATGYL